MSEAALGSRDMPAGIPDASPALRTALVGAIARRRRRLRARAATACAAGIAVAGALGVGLSAGGPPQALAIETTGDWVEVRIVDADNAEAAAMTEQLQDAGIEVEVRTIPAPADLVGSWMGILQPGSPPPDSHVGPDGLAPAPPPLLDADESRTTHNVFSIRRDAVSKLAGHQFVLYVGRAPQPGEQPEMLSGDGPYPVDAQDRPPDEPVGP